MEFRRINDAAALRLHHHRRPEGRGAASRAATSSTWASATRTCRRPTIAVEKLSEAAHNTRNHRYSASRGIPKLRQAVADLYQRRFGVDLDPDTEVINTIGAKEGFSHLMWVLLAARRRRAGAVAVVPDPHLGPAASPAPTSARCPICAPTRTSSRT